MTTLTETPPRITAGVDTHRDLHVVAAPDERGGELGVESFPRRQLVTARHFAGSGDSGRWKESASKGPAHTEQP
jgi:hypothetical protein